MPGGGCDPGAPTIAPAGTPEPPFGPRGRVDSAYGLIRLGSDEDEDIREWPLRDESDPSDADADNARKGDEDENE